MGENHVIEITHHAGWVLLAFIIGYLAIIVEQLVKFNKAATSLLMAVVCWTILFAEPYESVERHLEIFSLQMFKVSQVLFFLLGALTIVEIINEHRGFQIITEKLTLFSKKKMFWIAGFLTFFLSAALDNLTTTIVMVSLISKLIDNQEERMLFGGMIVIAANVGGSWTPIGDVPLTLLWIYGQLSAFALIKYLFIPSLVGLMAAMLWISRNIKGDFDGQSIIREEIQPGGLIVLVIGISCLVLVPVFRLATNLPVFMGMILGLGLMWVITDLMHFKHDDRKHLMVPSILPKVDVSIILFYLGILLSINALESSGLLKTSSEWLELHISTHYIPILIGLVSSIVDNVSLVAASIGMFPLAAFPKDSPFWLQIAYCAGTGGSILIIGSAAGVALMALQKVSFIWYTKKMTFPALLTYFAGLGTYLYLS